MRVHRIGLWALCAASVAWLALPAAAQMTNDGYTFIDVKSTTDPSFTQLLGVNDMQEVAGYYGCGTLPNHPNKGFTLLFINSKNGPFTGNPAFTPENFPGSVQDQNFGVNNLANPSTAGFWQDANGVDHGYINVNGTFTTIDAPNTTTFGNQILGLDDNNDVAGFNTNAGGTTFAEVEFNAPGNTINTLQLGSPPLFPGPQSTATGCAGHRRETASATLRPAFSINSMPATPPAIVSRSASPICAGVRRACRCQASGEIVIGKMWGARHSRVSPA